MNISIAPGDFAAILGPNGSGKTTLLRVLLGELPLTRGTASVLGRPPGESKGQIGYLPQRQHFDAGTRIRGVDLVRLGLDGARWGLPLRHSADKRVDEVIALAGASGYARRPIGALSGGEQQRLLIAQALVSRPRLLILDEPLDSLDLPNQSGVAALLESTRSRSWSPPRARGGCPERTSDKLLPRFRESLQLEHADERPRLPQCRFRRGASHCPWGLLSRHVGFSVDGPRSSGDSQHRAREPVPPPPGIPATSTTTDFVMPRSFRPAARRASRVDFIPWTQRSTSTARSTLAVTGDRAYLEQASATERSVRPKPPPATSEEQA